MGSLNRAYTRLYMKRRYESWFLRFGQSDGSGAWWIRYLLTNPGRNGCAEVLGGAPAQVWATRFPLNERPETLIQQFPVSAVKLAPESAPFSLEIGANRIDENSYKGSIEAGVERISWDIRCCSNYCVTMSNKGWIGFSRTPHSDGIFSGEIRRGERVFRGDPLGVGVQGHNCGFRHRNFWTWMHASFPQPYGGVSTLEALTYEMPLGLRFRKVILWHRGQAYAFKKLRESVRDREEMKWNFEAWSSSERIEVAVDGGGQSLHRLPYVKTDCSGTFEVANNSRARAQMRLELRDRKEDLVTQDGSVLEMTGDY